MSELSNEKLTQIKRAAEDAIQACNRLYQPFIDVVAHPLNISSLVDMAKKSSGLSSENYNLKARFTQLEKEHADLLERLSRVMECVAQAKDGYYGFSGEGGDTDNLTKDLEKALRGASD